MTVRIVLQDKNLLQLVEVGDYMGSYDTDLKPIVKEWMDEQDMAFELVEHCSVVERDSVDPKTDIGYLLRMRSCDGEFIRGFKVISFEHVYQAAMFKFRWL